MTDKRRRTERQPLAWGTGLVALDVVMTAGDPSDPLIRTGGTCGNVLLALRYLGFRVSPVCRFREDLAAGLIRSEFHRWGVDASYVTADEEGSTPVILQTIRPNLGGVPSHSFSWRCPACGARFPGYKPVLAATSEDIAARMPAPEVFFFDRANRGSLTLATKASQQGALVVFEPSGVADAGLFEEACEVAHVVKYSHERLANLSDSLEFGPEQLLQVETLGAGGLRYRARFGRRATSPWKTLKALKAPLVVDTAGAGDWCTAGLIHSLGRRGAEGYRTATPAGVEAALRYGQALSAWNCAFRGARGGMDHMTIAACQAQVRRILAGETQVERPMTRDIALSRSGSWCPICTDSASQDGASAGRIFV